MRCKNSLLLLFSAILLIFISSCKKDELSKVEKQLLGTYNVENI